MGARDSRATSRYGLTIKQSDSELVARNADAPKGSAEMRQIQGPCLADVYGIVGPYGFYVSKDFVTLNLYY